MEDQDYLALCEIEDGRQHEISVFSPTSDEFLDYVKKMRKGRLHPNGLSKHSVFLTISLNSRLLLPKRFGYGVMRSLKPAWIPDEEFSLPEFALMNRSEKNFSMKIFVPIGCSKPKTGMRGCFCLGTL